MTRSGRRKLGDQLMCRCIVVIAESGSNPRLITPTGHFVFEGVCLTHVNLATGACGRGARAAVPDTTPLHPVHPLHPLPPVDSAANSKKLVWEQSSITFGYFGDLTNTPQLLLLWGPPNDPKCCFGATFHHFWLLWGPSTPPKHAFDQLSLIFAYFWDPKTTPTKCC